MRGLPNSSIEGDGTLEVLNQVAQDCGADTIVRDQKKGTRYMLNKIMRKARKTLDTVKSHPTAVEMRAREKLAFEILHPQVEIVKRSPTAQILAGTALTAAILTGHWGTAAAIAGGWFGSKPLTHAVAGGVAGVGMVDAKLRTALERLQAMQVELEGSAS